MSNLNFIPDRTINLQEADLLGTSPYVDLLKQIIQDCPTPYTIGIFGSWGSGKSSIIKTLENELNKTNRKNIFIYDAWKYSKDDFRRTFLLELRKFLGLKTEDEEELFYKDKVEEIKFKPKLDKLTLGIVAISLSLSFLIGNFWLSLETIQNIIGSTSFVALITLIFSILRQTFVYHKVAVTTSKLFAPEQFEARFEKTIKEFKGENLKLIIAIDNIDRCHKEQVLEILLTIKNFLEKDGVTFIIPLDDNGLSNYLQMSHQDANEFIRKIFNTTIRIKNFSENNLYEFGIKLCEKYGINLPKKEVVISMVAQEFSRNPRKIIQFLNTLQTELYLSNLQEKNGLIPRESTSNNIGMFVKILIIHEEYPELYKMIADKKYLINEINEIVKNGEFEYERNDKDGRPYKLGKINLSLTEEQMRFFRRTSNIVIDTHLLEPFFNVKDIFKDIPDDFYQLVISQDWDNIKKRIEKEEITVEQLIKFIDKQLNEDVIKRDLYETTGYNLVSLFFKIIYENQGVLSFVDSAKNIHSILEDSKIWNQLFNFNPKNMCNAIKQLEDEGKCKYTSKIIDKINEVDTKVVKNEHLNLIKHFVLTFDQETIKSINNKFLELLQTNFGYFETFKEILRTEKIKYLLNNDFATFIISQLTQDYKKNQTEIKVDILKSMNLHNMLDKNTINSYINKCVANIWYLQNYNNWEWFKFWLEACKCFILKIDDANIIESLFNTIKQNYQFIQSNYNQKNFSAPYLDIYKAFISVVGELYTTASIMNLTNIIQDCKQWLTSFYNYSMNQEVAEHTNKVIKFIIGETKTADFTDTVIGNFNNAPNFDNKKNIFSTIQKILDKSPNIQPASIKALVKHLSESLLNVQQAQEAKEIEDWIMQLCSNKLFLDEFFKVVKDLSESEDLKKFLPIFKYLIKSNFEDIFSKLRELLASTDTKKQEVGIALLYNLYDQAQDDFNEKKEVIIPLLNEIKEEKLSEEYKNQLNEIKKKIR